MSLEIFQAELVAAIKRGTAQQKLVEASKRALDGAIAAGLPQTVARCDARWKRQLVALEDTKRGIVELEAAIAKIRQPDLVDAAASAKPRR